MNKETFVNDVIFKMSMYIDRDSTERLRNVLICDLSNYDLNEKAMLPGIDVFDNEYIIKRYIVDMVAINKEKTTIYQYVRAIRLLWDSCKKSWDRVTGEDITTYFAIRTVNDHISSNYKDSLYTYVSSFYRWAYKKGYMDIDITKSLDRVKRQPRKIDRITDEEIAVVKGIRKNSLYNCLFYVMIECGLRVSEIQDLRIENIDWKNRTISVWAEKTNEYRTTILTHDLEYAIQEHIGNRKTGYVFEPVRGEKMSKNYIEKMARLMGEDAECHCKTTVHIFRKTFASILYRKTHDILLVSKLLGHKDTAVTIRCYLKDDIEEMKHRRLQVC